MVYFNGKQNVFIIPRSAPSANDYNYLEKNTREITQYHCKEHHIKYYSKYPVFNYNRLKFNQTINFYLGSSLQKHMVNSCKK